MPNWALIVCLFSWPRKWNTGNTCQHLGTYGHTWVHMVTLGYTWPHLGTSGHTWVHRTTPGYIKSHLGTSGNTWVHLATPGYTWQHLGTFGHTRVHLATPGYIWPHMVTYGPTLLHIAPPGYIWQHLGTPGYMLTPLSAAISLNGDDLQTSGSDEWISENWFKICVSILKQVNTDSIWFYIVLVGQEWSACGKITHEMGPKKHPNVFRC